MKLPSFLKNWIGSKPTDEKDSTIIEMSSRESVGLSAESKFTNPPRSYRQSIAKSCYLLSFAVGTIGTYFTLRSQTTDDTDMPSRVLYSLTLMSAGLLLEVARVAASDASEEPITNSPETPDTQKFKEIDTLITEEKFDLKQQAVNQPQASSPGSPPDEADPLFPSEESKALTKKEAAAVLTVQSTAVPQPIRFWPSFSTSLNAFSVAWFGQAFSLFVRNTLVESSSSHLLPYTTLIGLASGHLFYVCLKPWRWWGLRDWIVANRNVLAGTEGILFYFLPPIIGQDLSVYYYTISAFWSGFNLNDGTSFITQKLLEKKLPVKITDEIFMDREVKQSIAYSYWRNGFPITAIGGIFISSAILLLQFIQDTTGFRNLFATLSSAIGCYLLTYPLGATLGRKIPPRYYHDVLELCIYLLIPFAAPDLSILHLLAMASAGVCGGIAHHIYDGRYKKRLGMMRQQLEEIEKQLITFPVLIKQLLRLPLPEDKFLIETRKKNGKYVLIARPTYLIVFICALVTQSLWQYPAVTICAVTSLLLLPVTISFILPKYVPSVYKFHPISWLSHVLYSDSDSFSLIYMIKVMAFITVQNTYDSHGNFLLSQKTKSPITIFSINFAYILYFFSVIKGGYKFKQGGYVPYFPSDQEIKKLMLLTDPEHIKQHLKNVINCKKQPISLNYHLLQFMKHNLKLTAEYKIETTIHPGQAEQKSHTKNSCSHPLSRLTLFSLSHHLPSDVNPENDTHSFPLAAVRCEDCAQDVMQINSEFDQRSQQYTKTRFDVGFYTSSGNALVRGNALARQFTFGLPAGLSLAQGVKSFSI